MSIFGRIASAVFGKGKTPAAASLVPGAPGAPAPQGTATVGGAPATGKAMAQAELSPPHGLSPWPGLLTKYSRS
jgi:hypothetical protein